MKLGCRSNDEHPLNSLKPVEMRWRYDSYSIHKFHNPHFRHHVASKFHFQLPFFSCSNCALRMPKARLVKLSLQWPGLENAENHGYLHMFGWSSQETYRLSMVEVCTVYVYIDILTIYIYMYILYIYNFIYICRYRCIRTNVYMYRYASWNVNVFVGVPMSALGFCWFYKGPLLSTPHMKVLVS